MPVYVACSVANSRLTLHNPGMSKELLLALDRSARHFDVDGRLHVDRSHISKAGVNPYYGAEIPGWQDLGLVADKVYRLFRDPVELEKGSATFARLPILSKHVPVTVAAPQPDLIVGAIGSEVTFSAPYLDADLCVWDAAAIAGIETDEVRELSCGYRYDAVMTPGVYEGQEYDGVMTNIRGNHLALVPVGRAGSDVVVSDHNPFVSKEPPAMKMSKLGRALFAALSAASPVLAQDAAVPALVGAASRKTFKKEEVKGKLLALDASLDSNKLDAVLDAILDVEESPTPIVDPLSAADESPADKVKSMLAGKVDDATIEAICALLTPQAAADEGKDAMTPEKVEAAMDSMRKGLMAAADAAREVRPVVGDVIGMDSAEAIYGFALDHLKVDRAGVTDPKALKAMFKLATTKPAAAPAPARIAMDAATRLETVFPDAARLGAA